MVRRILKTDGTIEVHKDYLRRYKKYSFKDGACGTEKQFEASITRLYHTIEKGLSYENYRAGFGKDNVTILIKSMEQYAALYNVEKFFYETALSTLWKYINKNRAYGVVDENLERRIKDLPGKPNDVGGTVLVTKTDITEIQKMNYQEIVEARHSIRHFSPHPVQIERIEKALEIAQHTASACNRQGWNAYIVTEKKKVHDILQNQNGNRGFGQEIDKILVLTFDLQYANSNREIYQGFIDGGMYATNVLNALFFEGVGSIPLSASLSIYQERIIRSILNMPDSEVFILFVGLGNYPESTLTARSARHEARYSVL